MARYLLSSRTLLDVSQRKDQPGEVWLRAAAQKKGVIARDLCISAVAPMAVRRELQRRITAVKAGAPDPDFSLDDLQQMSRNAETLFAQFTRDDAIAPVTAAVAERWGDLLDQAISYVDGAGGLYAIGSVQKLEIATAIIGRVGIPYTYVERRQAAHASLAGLEVEDPRDQDTSGR